MKGRCVMTKVEEMLAASKLGEILHKNDKKACCNKKVVWILAIIGAIAVIAAGAYALYRYKKADALDDFDDFDDLDDEFEDEFEEFDAELKDAANTEN